MNSRHKSWYPFLQAFVYLCLAVSLFAAFSVIAFQESAGTLSGATLSLSHWTQRFMELHLSAYAMVIGFFGLLLLRLPEKFGVLACMIILAFVAKPHFV